MNRDRITGNLKEFMGTLRVRWGRFTSNPVTEIAGTRQQQAGRYQIRYGLSKEQSARQLEDFRQRNREWDPSNQ